MTYVRSLGNYQSTAPTQLDEPCASGRILELCRRLDWRFLLPDPDLRRIGYFGEACELLEALQKFGESVTVVPGGNLKSGASGTRFDTVVLRQPSLETLETAGHMIDAGGQLYIEAGGGLGRVSSRKVLSRGLVGIMKYARVLWNMQFDDIQAYWHRPGFESCHQIVPLFDRVAMKFILSREHPTNVVGEARLIAARCLLTSGLLPHIVPCYSVIAQKRNVQVSAVEHRN
jgi:hypothetical protein